MTWHSHNLSACAPAPLASYLKALGILRILAEQVDPEIRGWWEGDSFHLLAPLDERQLRDFFLEEYAPTPLISPWNGGSGFYPTDSTSGFEAILNSRAARLQPYRRVLQHGEGLVAGRAKRPEGDEKTAMLMQIRRECDDSTLAWIGAATVDLGGEAGIAFPRLLGTGGNERRLEYSNNYMQVIIDLVDPESGGPTPLARRLIDPALQATPAPALGSQKSGQFAPGSLGWMNAGAGFDGRAAFNAWDFLWMLEGTLVLQVSAVRRTDSQAQSSTASPFAVYGDASDFGSSAQGEENHGEQWMPLWSSPSTQREVGALFREGRLRARREHAKEALDAARAIATRGAQRGVSAFQRYGYLGRYGRSNVAVPLGRWEVRHRPETLLLDEVLPWVERLRRATRDPERDPTSLRQQLRRIEAAMLELYREGGGLAFRWQALVTALAGAEDAMRDRPKHTVERYLRPLPRLSAEWAMNCLDDTVESRLALSLASQAHPSGGIRAHCLPLKRGRFATTDSRLAHSTRVVWTGRDLIGDLNAIVHRRLVEAAQSRKAAGTDTKEDGTPERRSVLFPLRGEVPVAMADLSDLVLGQVDEGKVSALARGLMSVRWQGARIGELRRRLRRRGERDVLPAMALIALTYPRRPVDGHQPRLDPRPAALLRAGRLDAAINAAERRLRAAGRRPSIRWAAGPAALARRIGASIAFTVNMHDLQRALERFTLTDSHEETPLVQETHDA